MGDITAAHMHEGVPGFVIDLAGAEAEVQERVHDGSQARIVRYVPTFYDRYVKPVLDRVLAAAALVVLLPVMLVIMLTIRLTMGSPVIFRQQRVGRHGRAFTVYKFTTMVPDRRISEETFDGPERRHRHKSNGDPRVTRLGRLLRKTSLDELPQLVNVLRGEMSLVGPRPELVELVARHYQPWQLQRHHVKPGITGLWQVSDRGSGLIYENVGPDLDYVEAVSAGLDCRILLLTVATFLGRSSGY